MIPPPPPPPPINPENGNIPTPHKQPSSTFLVVMNIVNTFTQILIGSIACVAFFFAIMTNYPEHFDQHIFLCVTGYIIMMSQAVLVVSPFSWSSSLKHQHKTSIHWVMQIFGSVLAITGSAIRISNRDNHFENAHGILGILALIFTTISLVGGIVNLWCGSSKLTKIGHSCFGSLTLILAFLSLTFAFDKPIVRDLVTDENSNMMISLTVMAMIGTLTPACLNTVKRLTK